MKGLELSKQYYLEYGAPAIHELFPNIEDKLAVGLVGSGSECFGYDDEVSKDHDFEAGFCIFIPDEDIIDRRTCFLLERMYAKLPNEYMGVKKSILSPVGGNRHGIIRTSDFYRSKVGRADGNLTIDEWLRISDYSLLEATDGEIFSDNYGEFSKIRNSLMHYPLDIRLKKLAGNILLMAQSGQYNFLRCIFHNQKSAAQLAIYEFVKSALASAFLISDKYMPYYKWSFKALGQLDDFKNLEEYLNFLMTTDNNEENIDKKSELIENISKSFIQLLQERNLSKDTSQDLEKHAYSINDKIEDSNIRNLHILYAI